MRIYGIIAICVAALDQLIKTYVRGYPQGTIFFEIPGVVAFESCINTGAAFSVFSGKTLFLAMISVVLMSMILLYAGRKMHLTPLARVLLACLIGGGIGNFLDRLFFSGVTDFIRVQFIDFPVFNLADIAITFSIAVLMILLLTDTLEEKCGSDH